MAGELRRRGRQSKCCAELGIAKMEDPELLEKLATMLDSAGPWVLVTDDDHMPDEHAEVVAKFGTTIATVDGRNRPQGPEEEEWKWETVQRWAHVMALQPPCSVHRYGRNSHRIWTPRSR